MILLRLLITIALLLSFGCLSLADAQSEITDAIISHDEGGPVAISGSVTYTNPLFTSGVAEPLVILEDEAGFVDRNTTFILPPESQTLGQITSDFFTSPFTYSLTLPAVPQGSLRDVDNDAQADAGVQIFAVAYWSNTFGDPYLETRDLYGGGWSSAYASTRVSADADRLREIIGGTLIVYAGGDQQEFPSEFGADGLLFTGDEPVVRLPAGYTVVNLDTTPFTFDRSQYPVIDLLEGEAAVDDFSDLSYADAFDAMLDKMRHKYAFTDYKHIDWDALAAQFRPLFVEADTNQDESAYETALRGFLRSIPDGHVSAGISYDEMFGKFAEGLGMAARELDDGRVIVAYVSPDGAAAAAGIELGAVLIAVGGTSMSDFVSAVTPPMSFSTEINQRLEQVHWGLRFPTGTAVKITYRNPNGSEEVAILQTQAEWESFYALDPVSTGFELPVEYHLLDSDYAYVKIKSFSDNSLLTVQLWERMIETLSARDTPGLIIDMRANGGGSTFLAEQMAAYFFAESHILGNTGGYDHERDTFVFDERSRGRFYLPPNGLRYDGAIAVLIGPNCYSACEFFSYAMTIDDRAAMVGQYPTGGLGGTIQDFFMPKGERVRFTVGRTVDAQGNIHIEGKGVAPTVRVPVTEATVVDAGDPILDAAINYLDANI